MLIVIIGDELHRKAVYFGKTPKSTAHTMPTERISTMITPAIPYIFIITPIISIL
jgi:hypothetical protein